MATTTLSPTCESTASHEVGDLVLRYLADERAYHVDLLHMLRQLGVGRMTAEHQAEMDDLRSRRETLSEQRAELLNVLPTMRAGAATLSDLIEFCHVDRRGELRAQVQAVRSFIIQARLAAERLGRRLELLHDCLEEILTGKPPIKSASYDRAGRLNSSPSNRSLLARRA